MALITVNCFSESLGMATAMNVLLPDSYRTDQEAKGARPPAVLYLLHGLSDDHSAWQRKTSLERYVEGKNLAVVMPAVQRSFYTDMAYGGTYFKFIGEELPRMVAQLFNVANGPENTFVAGLSMGGYGATKLGLTFPERFGAVASLSGALDVEKRLLREDPMFQRDMLALYGDPPVIPAEEDLFHLAQNALIAGRKLPPLFIACGVDDFLYPDHQKFKAFAQKNALDATFHEAPGVHDWVFWDAWIQRVLDWLPLAEN